LPIVDPKTPVQGCGGDHVVLQRAHGQPLPHVNNFGPSFGFGIRHPTYPRGNITREWAIAPGKCVNSLQPDRPGELTLGHVQETTGPLLSFPEEANNSCRPQFLLQTKGFCIRFFRHGPHGGFVWNHLDQANAFCAAFLGLSSFPRVVVDF